MKKPSVFLFLALCILFFTNCEAQNPSYKQKLYYTCKVWGFVKYFHSYVSVYGVNWDSVLIADLPLVKSAVTSNDFNNALDTMLKAAGPMAIATTPPCDTVPPELSRNLNFGWISSPVLRADVQTILDTIKNNFRPHSECWVEINPNPADGGYLKFQGGDSLILNVNDYTNYPDEPHRLFELFSYWNIINYFNPFNSILDQPWDTTLNQNIISIDTANNDSAYFTVFMKIIANLDDAHVGGWTYDNYCEVPLQGWYSPNNLVLKYIPGKYIVAKSGVTGLAVGDQIISVNGLTTKQWEDSLKPYISAGDSGAFQATMEEFLIEYSSGSNITLVYFDSLNNIQTNTALCTSFLPYQSYYPNDSLAKVNWRYWAGCNVGYINAKNMLDVGTDFSNMYSALQNTNAIIFDIRNYPASYAIANFSEYYEFPTTTLIQKGITPNVEYPGTYYWQNFYAYNNPNMYLGKIIVLVNEQTMSYAESNAMVLKESPNSTIIGSQTAGTDGTVTYFNLSQDMGTGFTTQSVYYPNGDTIERKGVIPDIIMYPTQEGIRHGRDELLEKALQVAGCITSVPTVNKPENEISVFPNPSTGIFTFSATGGAVGMANMTVEVFNVLGEKVYSSALPQTPKGALNSVNLSKQPNGVYFYRVMQEDGSVVGSGKLVIEK